MKELQYAGGSCGGSGELDIPDSSAEVLPLDPIPGDVVGCLNLRKVLRHMEVEMPDLKKLLTEIFDGRRVGYQHQHQTKVPVVSKKYGCHIDDLKRRFVDPNTGEDRCGILEFAYALEHSRMHRWISGYFAIRKGLTKFARSIFNGKALSRLCRQPPNVNLFELREMLHECCKFPGAFFGLDLRHWFHQVRWSEASEELRMLFTIVYDYLASRIGASQA